jgi:hypothetical protein
LCGLAASEVVVVDRKVMLLAIPIDVNDANKTARVVVVIEAAGFRAVVGAAA